MLRIIGTYGGGWRSKWTPAREQKNCRTPPPALHVTLLSSMSAMTDPKSDAGLSRPAPQRAHCKQNTGALVVAEGSAGSQVPRADEHVLPPASVLPSKSGLNPEEPFETERLLLHEGNARGPFVLTSLDEAPRLLAGIGTKDARRRNRDQQIVCPRGHRREHDHDEHDGDDSGLKTCRFLLNRDPPFARSNRRTFGAATMMLEPVPKVVAA